jgi:hypothetical protein
MKVWFVAITTLLLTSSESTALDATGVTNVFVAACAVVEGGPVHSDVAEPAPGIVRTFTFRSGPRPGTWHGDITFRDASLSIVMREQEFCALRSDPSDPSQVRIALDHHFGAPNEDGRWRVGEGSIEYRPFQEGRTGPDWVSLPSGYHFGFDAAERLDTLVFYAPPAN